MFSLNKNYPNEFHGFLDLVSFLNLQIRYIKRIVFSEYLKQKQQLRRIINASKAVRISYYCLLLCRI